MQNSIIFKGSNGKLIIVLDSEITFEKLKEKLEEKLIQSRQFLMDLETVIQFRGRDLTEIEELELIEIINKTVKINILLVSDGKEVYRKIEEEKLPDLVNEGITKFHFGTLRSGEKLVYSGNIVILGDVNPGSIVKAEGNIVVMGILNGIAHAGINGNTNAFIVASNMSPFQLKIGEILFKNYNNEILVRSKLLGNEKNRLAYLKDDRLVIDEITSKSLKSIMVT